MNENSIHPLDEQVARLVEQLQALAGASQPRPEFAAQLEADLLAQWKPNPTQDAPRRIIHLTNLWRQPMLKRLSFALIGAAIVTLTLGFALPLLLGDGSGPLAPLPLLADQPELAGDFQAGRPMGPLGDVELVLEADLPEGPPEAPVYRQASGALPTTSEEALAWAERFNLSNPQVYHDVRDPGTLIVIAEDGQTLSFNADAPWAISYGRGVNPFTEWRPGDPDTPPPLGFEAARDVAIAFLEAHELLPDVYQVEEESEMAPTNVESPPIRHVLIRPLLDGYLVEGHNAEIRVQVGPDGTVYSAWLSPLAFAQGETYPLRSAQAAFEALRTGDVKGPFRLSIDWRAPPEAVAEAAQTTYYRPEPATYQAGDAATVRGYVELLRAVATGEVRASLLNDDGTFELTGPALEEMAAELGYNQVVVRGTIQAELSPGHWRLAVSDWSIAPPQANRFIGTVEMEGGITSLVTDDGVRYRLLSPPDGLSAGDRAAVYAYAEVVPAEDEEPPGLRWLGIESPPATQQYVGGSSESVSVVVEEVQGEKEVIEAAPGPAVPVTQVIVGALYFEDDGPVLETPEGQRFRVVDLPDELNTGRDGRVIAVRGQVTPPSEAGDLPTLVWEAEEPVLEPEELHQESVSEQVEVAPPAGYEPPVSPYQVGDEVELEGQVGASIYVNGDERRVEAWFGVGLGPDYDLNYRLSGPSDLLEELAQYDRLHLRLQARVILDEDSLLGQGLEVIRFEKIWPEEKVQGFLGTIGMETLDGREVAVFNDKESGQRYVLFRSLGSDFTPDFYDYSPDMHEQVFLTGVVRPDQTFAGLPVIEEAGMRTGSDVDAATSADQLPLEAPQVIDKSKMMRLKGRAIIDGVELAYYAPPGALGQRPGAEAQPEFSLVQPVWVFHGHSEDGRATFRAYVQAVADDYLQ
jgi:hypothetical protein